MDRLAAVEHLAHQGEVVVSSQALEPIADHIVIHEWRTGLDGEKVGVVSKLHETIPR